MGELNDEDFIKFLESYKNGSYEDEYHNSHKFYDTITELSRSDTYQADSLIEHEQKMYGLDWIVKASERLKNKPPKSTDALYFNEKTSELHIIEFKFIGRKSHRDKINILWADIRRRLPCENCEVDEEEECFDEFFVKDFRLIKENFKDPVNVSLQLKPYEVIYITLPELYAEYCENEHTPKKDINGYLNKINKYYWTFVGNFSQSEYNIKSKADKFNKYNKRLEMTIFKKAQAKPRQQFQNVLKWEILKTEILGDII